ncbi:DUF72 domain-containing protein [Gallaecimonas kandeliae]|uniref:DUF72 domain-containing protein n=1 Tax=Gallaecimonas kandeliae TaxID=3029055 RepID=UPI0026485E4D|nr:DUF72 domain-containing protein [Gallaecimonas kandeliae]WKE64495.1 DUF72 domain-containing protein [Gallaecimonas kandeliae]
MWSHPAWKHWLFPPGTPSTEHLAHYARVFNAVEGNTSFYALPSEASVARWTKAVPAHFRFTFKFPQAISHHKALVGCDKELDDFLSRFAPLHGQISHYLLQLPAQFGPERLPALAAFLDALPKGLPVAVEVRHRAFFDKGEAERAFNRLLLERNCDRIIMDSRPVFSVPATDAVLLDAQQKKPRVPVHAIATGQNPVVRFVALPEPGLNHGFLAPWLDKLVQWLAEGKTPSFFVHSADNDQAPMLARWFYEEVAKRHPLPPLPPFAQPGLF